MPVQPTYPGVYIEELPSGVRTITGVSTSVAAFVGAAKRGPINKAVHVLSYTDYERRFGGLDAGSEMSYAVRQFFLNGGTDAWVVRLAKGAQAAFRDLFPNTGPKTLTVTALEEGVSGNRIEVRVGHDTVNPASTFNLSLQFTSQDNPGDSRSETYANLSMNSKDPRYVEDVINGDSQLVTVTRTVSPAILNALSPGTSVSGDLSAAGYLNTALDASHNSLIVWVNGLDPVTVQIALPGTWGTLTDVQRLGEICAQIGSQVTTGATNQALSGFTCGPNNDKTRIVMSSGVGGESSWIRVLPAPANDASVRLRLGVAGGGVETDAVAAIRPRESPDHGKLTGGAVTDAGLTTAIATVPQAGKQMFVISLDGTPPLPIDLGTQVAGGNDLPAHLKDLAGRIQAKVRELKPTHAAYSGFTCAAGANQLVLTSGTRGTGSSVFVAQQGNDGLAAILNLLVTATPGKAETLESGNEQPLTPGDIYNAFIANRSKRQGIYALEGVDLFNLLCLPGITDPGVLADADSYCRERRAFLIIDAPPAAKDPAAMVTTASGTALPKSDYAAVYWPWVRIADPLKGGKLRTTAPCGTIAGLYARTDASRGVWKAPAGTEATLAGVLAAEYSLTDRENGTLNPLGVNCIRVLPVYGAVAWGARTLRGADAMTSEWKYIPIRRLALYIEESLYRGTQWVVFEPNDEPLWAQIRLNLGAFMHTLFRQGAFQGKTPREAYLVKCDRETTTQDDINRGVVNIVVGFAPLKPAEFVILKIQQLAGQIQA